MAKPLTYAVRCRSGYSPGKEEEYVRCILREAHVAAEKNKRGADKDVVNRATAALVRLQPLYPAGVPGKKVLDQAQFKKYAGITHGLWPWLDGYGGIQVVQKKGGRKYVIVETFRPALQRVLGMSAQQRKLPNKPLVEAIFEFRWKMSQQEGDPHYPLFVGRLHDRVQSQYPFHEPLPTSLIPLPIALNVIQHRFRKEKERWPLIQVGPGIVTLNDTDGYDWADFGPRLKALVTAIYDGYPEPSQLKVASLTLRYLDAFELDPTENVLDYLAANLKTEVSLPSQLFRDTGVSAKPQSLNMMISFPTDVPKGTIHVKFANGIHKGKPVLVMETNAQSNAPNLPEMPGRLTDWSEATHRLTSDWFFKLIEGDLHRRFAG